MSAGMVDALLFGSLTGLAMLATAGVGLILWARAVEARALFAAAELSEMEAERARLALEAVSEHEAWLEDPGAGNIRETAKTALEMARAMPGDADQTEKAIRTFLDLDQAVKDLRDISGRDPTERGDHRAGRSAIMARIDAVSDALFFMRDAYDARALAFNALLFLPGMDVVSWIGGLDVYPLIGSERLSDSSETID